MGKEVKRFATVTEFNEVTEQFKESKAKLDSNQAWFVDRYGVRGGTEKLIDGNLTLTAKEATNADSVSYKNALEEVKDLIRSGKMYGKDKETALSMVESIVSKHTKPKFSSQKIVGKIKAKIMEQEQVTKLIG